MDKIRQYDKGEDRSPWRDGFAAAAQFAREMGLRRRAGFNPYGFEIFEPAMDAGSAEFMLKGFSQPDFNGPGL